VLPKGVIGPALRRGAVKVASPGIGGKGGAGSLLVGILIGLLLGGVNFSEQAVAVGAAVVKWGAFVQSIIDFLIIAAVIFWIVRTANAMQKPALAPAPAAPTTKECPYCRSAIHLKATRCPNCTSELRAA